MLAYSISAGAGFEWASDCNDARKKRAEYLLERRTESPPARRSFFPKKKARPLSGNGFFCSSLLCARTREACEESRLPDEPPCAAQPTAFCFGNERYKICRPTAPECERQLEQAGYGSRSQCEEVR
jgi:hypothetical protein